MPATSSFPAGKRKSSAKSALSGAACCTISGEVEVKHWSSHSSLQLAHHRGRVTRNCRRGLKLPQRATPSPAATVRQKAKTRDADGCRHGLPRGRVRGRVGYFFARKAHSLSATDNVLFLPIVLRTPRAIRYSMTRVAARTLCTSWSNHPFSELVSERKVNETLMLPM